MWFCHCYCERDVNKFKGTIVVQAVRPVYNTTYESPLLNLQDQRFAFEYIENENLIFNERQFSGKTLPMSSVSIFILFWDMMQTVSSLWEERNGLQKHSRLPRTLKTETMMAGIPSMNQEAVPY
jgi:hypothetical protein